MEKKQSFVVVSKIVNYFAQLASALKVTSSLVPHITRLKFFIDQWIAFAAAPITSENVSDPDAKRGVFDGVWWLDRELKDDFNKMGAEKMIGLLNSIRHAIEVAKFDPV
jgi:hypothetical protein